MTTMTRKRKWALAIGLAVAVAVPCAWRVRAATAEPKLETHLSEMDAERLRRGISELHALDLQAQPVRQEMQAMLDKYKLRFDDIGRGWVITDWTSREIQRRQATAPAAVSLPMVPQEKTVADKK